jgi:hypothetical protein
VLQRGSFAGARTGEGREVAVSDGLKLKAETAEEALLVSGHCPGVAPIGNQGDSAANPSFDGVGGEWFQEGPLLVDADGRGLAVWGDDY